MDPNDPNKDAPLQSDQKQGEETKKDPSDQLTPDHPRFKEVLSRAKEAEDKVASLQQQMDDLQTNINQRQSSTGDDELTQDERVAIARISRGLKSEQGFVTEEDLRVERRAREYERLSDKYDGNNSLPKFVPIEVETYAKQKGFGSNYEAAYKQMHFDAFVQQEAKKRSTDVDIPTSERPTGAQKEQAKDTLTNEEIAAMDDDEYERSRLKILGSIKAAARS